MIQSRIGYKAVRIQKGGLFSFLSSPNAVQYLRSEPVRTENGTPLMAFDTIEVTREFCLNNFHWISETNSIHRAVLIFEASYFPYQDRRDKDLREMLNLLGIHKPPKIVQKFWEEGAPGIKGHFLGSKPLLKGTVLAQDITLLRPLELVRDHGIRDWNEEEHRYLLER